MSTHDFTTDVHLTILLLCVRILHTVAPRNSQPRRRVRSLKREKTTDLSMDLRELAQTTETKHDHETKIEVEDLCVTWGTSELVVGEKNLF